MLEFCLQGEGGACIPACFFLHSLLATMAENVRYMDNVKVWCQPGWWAQVLPGGGHSILGPSLKAGEGYIPEELPLLGFWAHPPKPAPRWYAAGGEVCGG